LHDFEGSSTADAEDLIGEGNLVEEGVAYDFVDGIVAADVFAGDEALAGGIEKGGAVEAAGGVEGGLGDTEFFGEFENCFEGEFEALFFFDGCELLVDGFDAGFAAEAAA